MKTLSYQGGRNLRLHAYLLFLYGIQGIFSKKLKKFLVRIFVFFCSFVRISCEFVFIFVYIVFVFVICVFSAISPPQKSFGFLKNQCIIYMT